MHKVLGVLVALFAVLAFLVCPATVHAETASSEQRVVIHAAISASRTIIVNDKGQMTTIFSNTNESVTPEVHVLSAAGAVRPLTDELYDQYLTEIEGKGNLAGVTIDVPVQTQAINISILQKPTAASHASLNKDAQTTATTNFLAQLSPPFFAKS